MEPWRVIFLLTCVWAGELPGRTYTNNTRSRSHYSFHSHKTTSCPCGFSNKGRILGGIQSPSNKYPWMAGIIRNRDWSYICGAAIITEKVAITAAHCTAVNEPITLFLGTSDITKIDVLIPVVGYSFYNWGPKIKLGNDIVLLHLKIPITFGTRISPICLPSKKLNLEGRRVKILGWGRVGRGLPDPDNLMEADVQVFPFKKCKKYYKYLLFPQSQICIRSPGKGTCFGDSGGPVVWIDPETQMYTLVGVVSFGSPDCNTNIPSVNTDVSAHLSWIRSVILDGGCYRV